MFLLSLRLKFNMLADSNMVAAPQFYGGPKNFRQK